MKVLFSHNISKHFFYTYVIYFVEMCTYIIPNVSNYVQTQRNLWFYSGSRSVTLGEVRYTCQWSHNNSFNPCHLRERTTVIQQRLINIIFQYRSSVLCAIMTSHQLDVSHIKTLLLSFNTFIQRMTPSANDSVSQTYKYRIILNG